MLNKAQGCLVLLKDSALRAAECRRGREEGCYVLHVIVSATLRVLEAKLSSGESSVSK